jgi:hypothetical protein
MKPLDEIPCIFHAAAAVFAPIGLMFFLITWIAMDWIRYPGWTLHDDCA